MEEKIIPLQKQREIVITHSSEPILLFAGFLVGLTISVLFVLVSFFFSKTAKDLFDISKYPCLIFIALSLGVAKLRKIEYDFEKKYPIVFILSMSTLFLFSVIYILIPFGKKEMGIFLQSFRLSPIDPLSWLLLIIGAIFFSFIFANPVQQFLEMLHNWFLKLISDVDCQLVWEELNFYNILSETFYNAKRYSVIFSLVLFSPTNFYKIKKMLGKKISLLRRKIYLLLKEHIRKTDQVGYIRNGYIYGILLQAGISESQKVCERLKALVENQEFQIKNKKISLKLNYVIQPYDSNFNSEKEMVDKAINKIGSLSANDNRKHYS